MLIIFTIGNEYVWDSSIVGKGVWLEYIIIEQNIWFNET